MSPWHNIIEHFGIFKTADKVAAKRCNYWKMGNNYESPVVPFLISNF